MLWYRLGWTVLLFFGPRPVFLNLSLRSTLKCKGGKLSNLETLSLNGFQPNFWCWSDFVKMLIYLIKYRQKKHSRPSNFTLNRVLKKLRVHPKERVLEIYQIWVAKSVFLIGFPPNLIDYTIMMYCFHTRKNKSLSLF